MSLSCPMTMEIGMASLPRQKWAIPKDGPNVVDVKYASLYLLRTERISNPETTLES